MTFAKIFHEENANIVRYNIKGKAENDLNDDTCAAVVIDGKTFKIRCSSRNEIYDHRNFNKIFYHIDMRNKITGEKVFKFKTVNKQVFNDYISCLQEPADHKFRIVERQLNEPR